MHGVFKRVRVVDIAAASYAAAFFAWLALRTPGTPSTQFIGDVAFYPLGLAVAWANWRTARVPGLDARTRSGWYLLSLVRVVPLGERHRVERLLPGLRARGLARLGRQPGGLQNLMAVAAFLDVSGRDFVGRSRARFLLDAGLTVVAGFLLALFFGLSCSLRAARGPFRRPHGTGIDWLVFVVAAVGLLKKRDRGTRTALSGSSSPAWPTWWRTTFHVGAVRSATVCLSSG